MKGHHLHNHPNPFSNETAIRFELAAKENVSLKVFNSMGQPVMVLHEGGLDKGIHEFTFEAKHLPDGFYFYSLSAGNIFESKRMILVRL